jgi:hypothetical protein
VNTCTAILYIFKREVPVQASRRNFFGIAAERRRIIWYPGAILGESRLFPAKPVLNAAKNKETISFFLYPSYRGNPKRDTSRVGLGLL